MSSTNNRGRCELLAVVSARARAEDLDKVLSKESGAESSLGSALFVYDGSTLPVDCLVGVAQDLAAVDYQVVVFYLFAGEVGLEATLGVVRVVFLGI